MKRRKELAYWATFDRPRGPTSLMPLSFAAIDFHTRETVWKILAGYGFLYNNHHGWAYLGADGTLYVGVFGSIVAMRDGK